ncbi:MAG: hypothetical protein ACREHG_04920 [Candidatus Saccharimonadales bacterium]
MPTGDMWGPGVPAMQSGHPTVRYSKHGVKLARPIRRVFFWLFVWAVSMVALFFTSVIAAGIVMAIIKYRSS